MLVWLSVGLVACGAPPAPEPEVEPSSEISTLRLGPDGPALIPRVRDRLTFNSNPDQPIVFVNWRGFDKKELFIDGESVGVLPISLPLDIGDHTFEVLVGPGDKVAVERKVVAKPGILVLELSR